MSRGRTILVVGASAERRARCVAWLQQAGHEVDALASYDAALDLVARECPALVVCDLDPADGAAIAACRRFKTLSSETFVLQISPTLPPDAAELGDAVDAFLVDPIDTAEMVALARSLLRLQKVEAELRDSEERLQLAQESAGLAILDWLIPSNTFVHSQGFLDLFELPPRAPDASLQASEIVERIHPEDLPRLIEGLTADSRTAGSFEREYRIRTRDGAIRWIASRGRFFSNAAGVPERMLSLNFDVTQRRNAEHANAVLAAIVASTNDAIVSLDGVGDITSWNAGAERLFGLPAARAIGQSLLLILSGIADEASEAFRRQIGQGRSNEFEMRLTRPEGATVDISVASAPIRAANERVIGASLIMRDVSAQKGREDHVRFLMRELTHRSKNLLAVIQAMARQSLTKDITPEEFIRRFSDRLAGLAGSHDLLSGEQWRGVSLLDLVNSQMSHYKDLFGTRILLDGANLVIRPEAAQNIGIALHELSTNAAKYGALSNSDGQVRIAWHLDDTAERALHLSWREVGGPPVKPPTRRGFGHIVMDRITGRALDGQSGIRFEPDGVIWTLQVPAISAVVL